MPRARRQVEIRAAAAARATPADCTAHARLGTARRARHRRRRPWRRRAGAAAATAWRSSAGRHAERIFLDQGAVYESRRTDRRERLFLSPAPRAVPDSACSATAFDRRHCRASTPQLESHVVQHLRPSVPGHHLGRKPRAALGCVVDGCPPRIALTEADIQPYLDRAGPASRASPPSAASRSGRDPLGRVRGRETGGR